MILPLTGVVTDGTVPPGTIPQRVPTRQDIALPRGEPLTINLTVVGQDGAAFDLSAGSIRLGVRSYPTDEEAAVTVQAAIAAPATAGVATLDLDSNATLVLDERTRYRYDIHLLKDGRRWQLVPVSVFEVLPIISRPDDP